MTEPLWWIVGAYLVVGTAFLIANFQPRAQEQAVLRFQSSVGIELPAEIAERLRKQFLRNRRSSIVGGMVGLVASAVIINMTNSDSGAIEGMILAASAFAGPAVAVSITTLLSKQEWTNDQPRYARAQAVVLSDYVPAAERWLARGPAILAVLYFTAWAIAIGLGSHPAPSFPMLASGAGLALVSVGSLLIFEIAGRRVISMSNRVGSPEELVWEDALRSHTVRDIASAPALVGLYAILLALPRAFGEGPESTFFGWVGLVAVGVVLLLLLTTVILRPQRHFLRRLWPELAAATGKPYGAEGDG